MIINKEMNGTELVIQLEGWLDTTTAPELGAEITAIEEGVTALVFDFEKLEYISSAGLRQVVASSQKAASLNAQFSIRNAGCEVMDVFRLTGLDRKFDITEKAN